MNLTPAEARRKLVHTAVGSLALLLRFMSWREAALMAVAAFFFNWLALPRLGGRGLWREADHGRGYPIGILLYPLAVLGLILLTIGGRLIPAGEVALITLLEIVLGPLWVWAFLAERPATATLVGGLVVLTAVLVQARSDTAPAVLP